MGFQSKKAYMILAVVVTYSLFGIVTFLGLTMKNDYPDHPKRWDILILTQFWPATSCYSWKRLNASHKCFFPSQKNKWAINGLWPTKLGTRGPQSCNESLVFNIDVLSSIKDKLNEYWPEMEEMPTITKKVNSLSSAASPTNQNTWFYQWTNHGTCAASIPALNSEFKYFNQGIEWAEKYNMNDILEKSGIKVSSKLYVKDYWKAVKSVLKKNVWIQCLYKHDTKEQVLENIRICFDKTLKLTNCDGIMIKSHRHSAKIHSMLTNCDMKKTILYLDYNLAYNISSMNF